MGGASNGENRYRELVAGLPRPTPEQITGFCGYVSRAHSWYKKLPLTPPGEPFFLYLHPHVHECFVRLDRERPGEWRPIVREPADGGSGLPGFRVAGDLDEQPMGLNYHAKGLTTLQYRDRLDHWSFSNFGGPGLDREAAIRVAAGRCVVDDDIGTAVPVPTAVLELGLVHLRGTVSPLLGPVEDEYEQLREETGAPAHDDDRAAQFDEMAAAMGRVITWIYGN